MNSTSVRAHVTQTCNRLPGSASPRELAQNAAMNIHLQTAVLATALLATACATKPSATDEPTADAPRERPTPPSVMIEGEPMYTVLPKDAIPSISAPEFLSGEAAAAQMAPNEMVMGIVGKDGTAKADSAWQLDGHEIVNDTLDGDPIAATW